VTVRPLTPAQLAQRQAAPATHGANSDARIRPVARAQKRRLLRQIGLSASQLDGIALAYLDAWARGAAKVELIDRWIAEHGLIDDEGNVPGCMAMYVSLLNSCRLSAGKFADHLKARDVGDPSMVAILQGNGRRLP
jgi:hypothetical protein